MPGCRLWIKITRSQCVLLLKSVWLIYVSYICSTLVYKQKKWNFCISNIKWIIILKNRVKSIVKRKIRRSNKLIMFFLQIVNLEPKGAAQLGSILTILMVGLNRWDTTLVHLNYQKQDTQKNYGYFLILSCIFQQEFISFYNSFLFACLNLLPWIKKNRKKNKLYCYKSVLLVSQELRVTKVTVSKHWRK